MNDDAARHLGLFGATAIGVGAIVGGGVLALAGVAFAATGPSAMLAFGLNGAIAFLTAASFAQLATRFPESGGTYAYARKVLSIQVAFGVGWVVWFASIVAGVLYALGFASFAAQGIGRALVIVGLDAPWLDRASIKIVMAFLATAFYTLALARRAAGGGNAATIGKVVVFALLIVGGVIAWFRLPAGDLVARLDPFAPAGTVGLIGAMGFTFIALQGFDLIAAVGGEVRDPGRNLPRSMYLSLGIALAIYLPLLFVIATVGAPEEGIRAAAAADPEGLMASASERFLGTFGFWLVIGAGLLSMLSALQANLLGASRVAFAMARDRTLPRALGRMSATSGTPIVSVVVTAAMMALVVAAVGDVSAAGAASSLIFLVSFATVHWAVILVHRRSGRRGAPALPVIGGILCLALAIFQAFVVPSAGVVVASWLGIGAILYLSLLAPGARMADVSALALDPDLATLRGRSPLVLVPIANPDRAASLVDVADTVRTPGAGRVLLLSVVRLLADKNETQDRALQDAQTILDESLRRSLEHQLVAETLFTLSADPWAEIVRVASLHRCETVLLGLPKLTAPGIESRLEALIATLDADVVVLRAPRGWRIGEASRVLIPIGGRRDHSYLRARLLASLSRWGQRSFTFLRLVPTSTTDAERRRFERELKKLARDEAPGPHEVRVETTDDPAGALLHEAGGFDLIVMGINRGAGDQPALGELARQVAKDSVTPLALISRGGR